MIEASIIILTRNRENLLKQCLNSLLSYKNNHHEIIIIDNGSQDGTRKTLKNYKNITLIKNKKNIGVASGRNLGVKKALGKYVIFLDDDTLVKENDALSKIIKFMERNREIGIVGAKLIYPNGIIQESARSFPTPLSVLWRGTFLHKVFPNTPFYKNYVLGDFSHKRILEVDWIMGACQVVRREVFNTIGLLDEKYFYSYEDIDFCYRAKNQGWKIVYYPYSKVIHYYNRGSARRIFSRQKLEHIKSIIYFFSKKYLRINL